MAKKSENILEKLINRANDSIEKANQSLFDDPIFQTTKELVEQSIENPGMELDFSDCACDEEVGKKLTTKDRKALKSSTFCGPNRSFPVPDCKHVGTAKAYLNRSNFSKSTKQKIAACINRKAKQLGCTPGKKAKAK